MNYILKKYKSEITPPTVIVLVILPLTVKKYFSFILLLFFVSCGNETDINEILNVGKELTTKDLSKTNSTENITFIGQGLKGKIIELKKQNSNFKLKVQNTDLNYPFGNSKAENILLLSNGIQKINVRLKYNSTKKKFDILGFTTQ